jgi:hypothetical protein
MEPDKIRKVLNRDYRDYNVIVFVTVNSVIIEN